MAKTSIPILVDWESIKDYLGKADIVEVTRCKECIKKPLCMIYRETNDDYGYCAWAGRRTDARKEKGNEQKTDLP